MYLVLQNDCTNYTLYKVQQGLWTLLCQSNNLVLLNHKSFCYLEIREKCPRYLSDVLRSIPYTFKVCPICDLVALIISVLAPLAIKYSLLLLLDNLLVIDISSLKCNELSQNKLTHTKYS